MTWTERLKIKLYLLIKLPAAFWSGVKLIDNSSSSCIVSIKYSWRNTNPFRSIYFACLSMAAEFSTGFPAFYYIRQQKKNVSMLVVGQKAEFLKKATGRIQFKCDDIQLIRSTIDTVVYNNQPSSIAVTSIGRNSAGEEVAVFTFTWSFKSRAKH